MLEELDLEAKERIDKGGDTETQERDKYKDKKKRRVHKKGMDFKVLIAAFLIFPFPAFCFNVVALYIKPMK